MRKPASTEQLPLYLPLEAARAREDLIVSDANQEAVAFLDAWPQWPTPVAVLAGPIGAGKTHLAHIWAARAGAKFLKPAAIESLPAAVETCVVVEDLAQGTFNETWLFHLINSVRASGASLLMTSRKWPADWGISLPDLQSRMKLAHLMELNEPDDTLLSGVLQKLFSDRQLIVEPSVIDYLVFRMERSLASALTLADEIDRLSLAQKRAITKPLAAEALRELGWSQ